MTANQRDAKVPPLLIGYALLLLQFILLGLLMMSLAIDSTTTTRLALAGAWLALLIASLVALTVQPLVNRRLEAAGAQPSPHLLVPTERRARVERYLDLYRTAESTTDSTTADGAAVGSTERIAA